MSDAIMPEVGGEEENTNNSCANIECVITIYDKLLPKIIKTLNNEYTNGRITGKEYSSALTQQIVMLMQISSQYPLTNAQVKLVNAQEKETLDLIESKKNYLNKQVESEDKKALLYKRQAEAYDDNLRVKKAEIKGNTIGMVNAGGTVVDAEIWNDFKNAIENI